jgi:hypothetical protein
MSLTLAIMIHATAVLLLPERHSTLDSIRENLNDGGASILTTFKALRSGVYQFDADVSYESPC